MKIYRGPAEKTLSDETHWLVSQKDLSNEIEPWSDKKTYKVNITKDGIERRAVAHITLESTDIIALHRGLVEGLQEQAIQRKKLEETVNLLRRALSEIRTLTVLSAYDGESKAITKIKERAESALHSSGEE